VEASGNDSRSTAEGAARGPRPSPRPGAAARPRGRSRAGRQPQRQRHPAQGGPAASATAAETTVPARSTSSSSASWRRARRHRSETPMNSPQPESANQPTRRASASPSSGPTPSRSASAAPPSPRRPPPPRRAVREPAGRARGIRARASARPAPARRAPRGPARDLGEEQRVRGEHGEGPEDGGAQPADQEQRRGQAEQARCYLGRELDGAAPRSVVRLACSACGLAGHALMIPFRLRADPAAHDRARVGSRGAHALVAAPRRRLAAARLRRHERGRDRLSRRAVQARASASPP